MEPNLMKLPLKFVFASLIVLIGAMAFIMVHDKDDVPQSVARVSAYASFIALLLGLLAVVFNL